MSASEDIAALIPHQGAMCLLERVVEWDAGHAILATTTHRAISNPLRSGGRLRAVHLCEYGAQAMAIHGGLSARAAGQTARPGFLASLREVALNTNFVDTLAGELIVTVHQLLRSEAAWQYAFEVWHEDRLLASGRAAIMAQPR